MMKDDIQENFRYNDNTGEDEDSISTPIMKVYASPKTQKKTIQDKNDFIKVFEPHDNGLPTLSATVSFPKQRRKAGSTTCDK